MFSTTLITFWITSLATVFFEAPGYPALPNACSLALHTTCASIGPTKSRAFLRSSRHGLHIRSAVRFAQRKEFNRDAEVLDSGIKDFVERP